MLRALTSSPCRLGFYDDHVIPQADLQLSLGLVLGHCLLILCILAGLLQPGLLGQHICDVLLVIVLEALGRGACNDKAAAAAAAAAARQVPGELRQGNGQRGEASLRV
jgi:hypothetical protein